MEIKKINKIISIVGPTASGKSDLAIRIASKFQLPIVNCDSKLLYKGFNIGTAKPSIEDQERVKHFMIDVLDHNKRSNLHWFLEKSRKIIHQLDESNTIPLLVGGTGQYMWGILEGWDPPLIKPNEKLRSNIEKQIRDQGIKKVIQSYSKIYKLNENQDLENPRRLIRIIERLEAGFEGNSDRKIKDHNLDSLILGIKIDRKNNDRLLKKRIKGMLKSGWVEEVKNNMNQGIKPNSPAMLSIGYREILDFINKKVDENELEEKIYISTRKLMRHQDNWFKKSDKRIKWINFENSFHEADIIISEWLKN
ncbi:MAG: tRNA (adenosine(37)-N6)-dimethylallyltransferase MiaA [Chloroflexi bacterium]|nr:tRNA (adenosine(37)-N6)-dimethylallyltransferase MiaA [Chloroflexota bacterium]